MPEIKSMYKSELARQAGVSTRTFNRWLMQHRQVLAQMGISPKQQLLPPKAVRYLCETYCIELPTK